MGYILFYPTIVLRIALAEKTKNVNYEIDMQIYNLGSQASNVDIINNLYTILESFVQEKCLIVVNKYHIIEIEPNTLTSIMLRQIDLAKVKMKTTKRSSAFSNLIASCLAILFGRCLTGFYSYVNQ